MVSSTDRGCNAGLVSPAGNIEKLRFAIRYGADEIYFGGEKFNLRSQTGNFSEEDIAEAVKLCREKGVRSVFLLNSYLHEGDVDSARGYIDIIKSMNPDAVMFSDPGMLVLLRESGIGSELHLSTQTSTLNSLSVKFWKESGVKRIVLARETTIEEIRQIRESTDIELEIFAHGALCISYSGRCLLSRFLSGRDANQGSCSHPCRWRYSLVEEKRPGRLMDIVEYARGTEILSSKDLCLAEKLPAYMDAGVNFFKIEGRMKSIYYTANTTRIYKHALSCSHSPEDTAKNMPFWLKELDLTSHRPYTDDLFNEFADTGFTDIAYIKKALFLGYKQSDGMSAEIQVKIFNPIYRGENIEAIFPIRDGKIIDGSFTIEEIVDGGAQSDIARPGRTCIIRFDRPVADDAIFRRRL
jgi:putative protease